MLQHNGSAWHSRAVLPLAVALVLTLVGCSSTPTSSSRYSLKQDVEPKGGFDPSNVPPVVPTAEPKSRGGNKSPYTVWGKQYTVLDSAKGYNQTGLASWYGAKFHGHATSNGEIYNMYAFSAAHKNLPLPTFARVTNLKNGRSIVVRVNDRGPFHEDRLIDLSYAAALSLDVVKTGTAPVRVEALLPQDEVSPLDSLQQATKPATPVPGSALPKAAVAQSVQPAVAPTRPAVRSTVGEGSMFLQIGAFSTRERAQQVKDELQGMLKGLVTPQGPDVFIEEIASAERMLHRVRIGPLESSNELPQFQSRLAKTSYSGTLVIPANPQASAATVQ
ncbi:MAG: septal ring lytic transglycosylase RlpA family lipoprotein [unclassified Hahellaceae]|nr:septal ring lytic transglycosylase RlpA family lipoprotein [Hahellaceae bacterium]|tara:strand:+ start:62267 stop:63262 length:996 start_codon:yes stop_codon:yes gene_type:complete